MSRLYEELKRRKVFRVAVAYLVASWVLMQVADVLSPVLDLPDWAPKLVFFLLLIGFVPSLILAWAFEMTPTGVQRDAGRAASNGSPTAVGSKIEHIALGVVTLALVAAAGYWYSGIDSRWARDEAFPFIENYAAEADFESAYSIATEAEARLPGNETLAELWTSISWLTSIPSQPQGASVYRRPYAKPDAEWEYLGKTPLYDIRIPLGLSVLRLEHDDYVPIIRIVGGATNGSSELPVQERPFTGAPQLNPGAIVFDTDESIPYGMVRVPGNSVEIDGRLVEIKDFYIDRYEVSNAQFKAFVESGAYEKRDLWEHEFVFDGEEIPWDEAMSRFVDTTGRPGPSTWESGTFHDGEGDHPVAGVSWYEAAAYARFVKHELPTIHHWRRAFAEGVMALILPGSNLDAAGTAPVGTFPGLGWTGTYDMAGNVREWSTTSVESQPIVVGGGWSDVPYVAHETITNPGGLPAFDRSPINGFRLASTNDDRLTTALLQQPLPRVNHGPIEDVVSDDVFAAMLRNFDYDAGPLDSIIEETRSFAHWDRQLVSFKSSDNEHRISLYLYLPKSNANRFQAIIYWPTIMALVVDSVEQQRLPLDFALKNGRAVALPILDGTFDRRRTGFPDWASVAGRDLVIQQIKDMRRSIDYLESRNDIDAEALAFYGFSWGGRVGPIALVADRRLKAAILNQAGLQHMAIPETSVANYLSRVTVPVLQFNGVYDTDFRFETSAKPFFDMLGTLEQDKKHVVGPTGHFVPRPVMIRESLNWLDKYLGPAAR